MECEGAGARGNGAATSSVLTPKAEGRAAIGSRRAVERIAAIASPLTLFGLPRGPVDMYDRPALADLLHDSGLGP